MFTFWLASLALFVVRWKGRVEAELLAGVQNESDRTASEQLFTGISKYETGKAGFSGKPAGALLGGPAAHNTYRARISPPASAHRVKGLRFCSPPELSCCTAEKELELGLFQVSDNIYSFASYGYCWPF